jgi:hypothetical protein
MRLLERLGTAWQYASGQRLVELLTQPAPPAPPAPGGFKLEAIAGSSAEGEHTGGFEAIGGSSSSGSKIAKKAPSGPVFATKPEPLGWFGYLLAHGGACLAYTYDYCESHKHLLPDMAASYEWQKGDIGRGPDVLIDDDWSRSTLMVNRFAEWPAPCVPRGSPRFLGYQGYDPGVRNRRAELRESLFCYHLNVDPSGGSFHGGEDYILGRKHYGGITSDLKMEVSAWGHGELHIDGSGRCYYRTHSHGNHIDKPIRPAENVLSYISYISSSDHRVHNKQLLLALPLLIANTQRQLVCPPFWRATADRRAEWWSRICYWFYNAQWLVWCAEMARLHCHLTRSLPAPQWWRDHCLAWGIGVPTLAQVLARRTFTHQMHEPDLELGDHISTTAGLVRGIKAPQLWEMLRLVVTYTPIPGSAGYCGEQIVPGEKKSDGKTARYRLHLLDIPPEAGAIVPPVKLDMWFPATSTKWSLGTTDTTLGADVIAPVINAVTSTVGSIVGAGALTSIGTALTQVAGQTISNVVMKVASVVLGRLWEIVREADPKFKIGAGDIVGIVGGVIGGVGAGAGIDLKGIPSDLWDNLKKVGAELEQFGDWSDLSSTLYDLQDKLTGLRDRLGWDYLDQAYGGLGLSETALNP